MKKMLIALVMVCFSSVFMRASNFTLFDKQIFVEKARLAFLQNKNAQLVQEGDFCGQKIERLEKSFCHLRKSIKKMKRNRQNIPGERKELSEITERSLVEEKSLYSKLETTKFELEAADDLFVVLQEQVVDGRKGIAAHLSNIICLEESALYAMRLELEKNEMLGKR